MLHALKETALKLNVQKCKFNHYVFCATPYPKMDITLTMIGSVQWPMHLPHMTHPPCVPFWVLHHGTLSSFQTLLLLLNRYVQHSRDSADLKFKWTAEAVSSFAEIKRLIAEGPALALYDPELLTFVNTDASDYGLGSLLIQFHSDNTERIVGFASRTLSPAEQKYSTAELEPLACVWAVERWRTCVDISLCYVHLR